MPETSPESAMQTPSRAEYDLPAPTPTLPGLAFGRESAVTDEVVLVRGARRQVIKKLTYAHEAMIDLILAEPTITKSELAAIFNRTVPWISQVLSTDAFKSRLEERRVAEVHPLIAASVNERLNAVANASLEKILEKLESPVALDDEFLHKSAKLATDALGYGARPQGGGATANVAVVIQVPPKITSAADWASAHTPAPVQLAKDA